MKDWTDIIGEQLESIQEPLPADDWKVLQQKHAASHKKKGVAAFVWAGSIVSAAAAVALALLLYLPGKNALPDNLVAESIPAEDVAPVEMYSVKDVLVEESPVDHFITERASVKKVYKREVANTDASKDDIQEDSASEITVISEEHVKEKVSTGKSVGEDDSSAKDFIAYASQANKNDGDTLQRQKVESAWDIEQLPEEVTVRKRIPVSYGVAVAVAERFQPGFGYGAAHDATVPDNTPITPPDSLRQEKYIPVKGGDDLGYKDSYDHQHPVSFGVSARFLLTRRFAVTTGLNYTKYTSIRKRYYYKYGETVKDKQYVHYIGVPLRLDWMLVNRARFNFYLGYGISVDKCFYASVDGERLREKEFIFSQLYAAGLQVNITPQAGIYFEPCVRYSQTPGTLATLRTKSDYMISAQGGLRFNF